MPQLDQFTYLTQFVRLCVLYSTFYVFLYHDGLPKISRILKLRKHLISLGATQSPSLVEQDVVFKEGFNISVSYPYSRVSGALSWCNRMVKSLKIHQLLRMNNSYVCSLGGINLSEVLKEHALDNVEGGPGKALRAFPDSGKRSAPLPRGPSYYHSTSLASSWHTAILNKIIVLRGQERI